MELIIKSNNEDSMAKITAFAETLGDVTIEWQNRSKEISQEDREELIRRILNFKSDEPSSFGDPVEWQREERKDRDLPFPE